MAWCHKQAGIIHAICLSSVGQQPAHQCIVVKQGQADRGLEPAWINGWLQFSGCVECAGLALLVLAELVPGEEAIGGSNGKAISPVDGGELVATALEQNEISAGWTQPRRARIGSKLVLSSGLAL